MSAEYFSEEARELTLANYIQRGPSTGTLQQVTVSGLDTAVADMLLIANNPAALSLSSELDIGDWALRTTVGPSADPNNPGAISIIKSCRGALKDLIRSPDKWFEPERYVTPISGSWATGAEEPAARLERYFSEAALRAGDNRAPGESANLYSHFASVVRDPEWMGFLLINLPLNPKSTLPPMLAPLADLIDGSNFYAHHVGCNWPYSDDLPTPLFGLIDYTEPCATQAAFSAGPRATANPVFLQALFANSTLVDLQTSPVV